jgi:hypothetical protein
MWLSTGLPFAGLAHPVLVLEARRRRLDLTTYHGGYERMSVLAVSFLAVGSPVPVFRARLAGRGPGEAVARHVNLPTVGPQMAACARPAPAA